MEFLSEIIYRDRFRIENGSHTKDAIIIVLKGKFECRIRGDHYTVGPGEICVFHADLPFQRRVIHPISCVYIQFDRFPYPIPSGILRSADPVRTENTVTHLFRAVEQENKTLTGHFLTDILLLHIHQDAHELQIDNTVAECIAYMTNHPDRHTTLELLSRRFSISRQGLIRKFKNSTGKTPMQYLSMLRLNRSKHLLKNTTFSVSEIAQQCGFENVYYFSNSFKKHTGISPSGYRKMVSL